MKIPQPPRSTTYRNGQNSIDMTDSGTPEVVARSDIHRAPLSNSQVKQSEAEKQHIKSNTAQDQVTPTHQFAGKKMIL